MGISMVLVEVDISDVETSAGLQDSEDVLSRFVIVTESDVPADETKDASVNDDVGAVLVVPSAGVLDGKELWASELELGAVSTVEDVASIDSVPEEAVDTTPGVDELISLDVRDESACREDDNGTAMRG